MSELKKHFERLMEFAKQGNFHKPFSQAYFVEDKNICRFSEKTDEILRQDIITLENYENRFNEIIKQGHSWINLNFTGMLEDDLLIVVGLPSYENKANLTSINLSLPEKRVIENEWNAAPFYNLAD